MVKEKPSIHPYMANSVLILSFAFSNTLTASSRLKIWFLRAMNMDTAFREKGE